MKNFILDSTYKDSVVINRNDDISIIPTDNIPSNMLNHHSVNLDQTSSSYISHNNKNSKFNRFSIIDYL